MAGKKNRDSCGLGVESVPSGNPCKLHIVGVVSCIIHDGCVESWEVDDSIVLEVVAILKRREVERTGGTEGEADHLIKNINYY